MKKKIIIPLAIIAVIIIIALIMFSSITSSKTVEAQLEVESGTVFVNGIEVTEYSELKQGDVVETGEDGLATIVLYESVVVNIDSNTKINIEDLTKEHPRISQEGGETWNQFTNLFGVEQYTIEAGNSVASVRGTAFGITEEKIVVDEGEVDYEIDQQKFSVKKGKVIEKIKEEIKEREITEQEREKIELKEERVIKQLEKLREREIEKHPRIVNYVKDKFSLEDSDIKESFKEIDEGKKDINKLEEKSPVKIESFDKIKRITEIIQEKKGVNVTRTPVINVDSSENIQTNKATTEYKNSEERGIVSPKIEEADNSKEVISFEKDSQINKDQVKTPLTDNDLKIIDKSSQSIDTSLKNRK